MSKIALITGTSSGIGLSAAVLLARSGFTVIATLRDTGRASPLRERAKSEGVELDVRRLDVEDGASVDACVKDVIQSHGRVDVLVNNAGAGYLGTLEQTSESELRRTFEVNFFGVCRMTQAVLPSMRAAGSGRIVSVTSVGGLVAQPFNDAYCAAKFAVEGCMESLAPVLKPFGIHVSLIEPGPVNTEFVANVGPSLSKRTADSADPYRKLLDAYLGATRGVYASVGQTGDDIARVILEAATSPEPHFRYPTSPLVKSIIERKYVDPSGDSALLVNGARLSL